MNRGRTTFTLTLYAASADPATEAIARALELLAVPYVRVDPTADPSATTQLRALSGGHGCAQLNADA